MMTPPTPYDPPEPSAPDEHLSTEQAFRRFVARVTPHVHRWLGWWGVPEADRDDVLQEILQATYKRRGSFDPARGRYEGWAYGFCVLIVLNHRKRARRRRHREAPAPDNLPQVSTGDTPDDERLILRRLLDKCIAQLEEHLSAVFRAREIDGIPMEEIAAAHGISLSTAYAYHAEARQLLQRALDREQGKKRQRGALVLPITLAQLIASDGGPPHAPTATMRKIWKHLGRLMAEDKARGLLGDDGTGTSPGAGGTGGGSSAVRRGARAVRGAGQRALRVVLDPQVLPALTLALGSAGGVGVTYALMRDHGGAEAHNDTLGNARGARYGAPALVVLTADPAPTGAEPSPTGAGATSNAAPQPRADVAARERADAGAGPLTQDDIAREQADFDLGSTAYQAGFYDDAINAFQKHARQYPRSRYGAMREKLLTLALIHADRKAEAHQRIEQLRRVSSDSPLLKELDAALPPERQP
jgi:RNA polymerase sigma factor (sigma-70 family)